MSKLKKSGGTATKAPPKKKAANPTKAAEPKVEVPQPEAPQAPVAPVAEVEAKPTKADKPLSCLDAAAQVLAERGEPMRAKDLIDAVFAAKLWHSDAPTPAATLVSAILRELKKGEASRFKKAGRGLFALNGK